MCVQAIILEMLGWMDAWILGIDYGRGWMGDRFPRLGWRLVWLVNSGSIAGSIAVSAGWVAVWWVVVVVAVVCCIVSNYDCLIR
jgi:hypothetical protein